MLPYLLALIWISGGRGYLLLPWKLGREPYQTFIPKNRNIFGEKSLTKFFKSFHWKKSDRVLNFVF